MERSRLIRILAVAAVVGIVALALAIATRSSRPVESPGAVNGPGAPGAPSVTVSPPGAPGSTGAPGQPGAGASGATGSPATSNATAGLPPDHPPIAPEPDPKGQVSIQYLGHAEFYLQSPGQTVVVTDPFDPGFTGYTDSKSGAHIVTVSHEHRDHNAVENITPFASMGAASVHVVRHDSYRQGDVTVTAVPSFHDDQGGSARGPNQIFLIEAGPLRIAHLGDLGHVLTPAQMQALGRVDVLLIPVGGYYTIGPDEATQVVKQLNPRLVIPMHYRTRATNPALAARLRPVEDFTVKFPQVEFKDDYVALVAPNTLPQSTTVWVLKYRQQ